MNKEEVLKAARNENANHDLVEDHINTEAGFFGYAIGAVLCMLLMLLRQVITGEAELACAIVYLGMFSTRLFTRYHMTKAKKTLVGAVVLCALTVIGLAVYVRNLLGAG